MEVKYLLIVVLYTIGNISCQYDDYSCDYKFGDPSWKYATVFHNKTHVIPANLETYAIYFDTSKMISFVCVNVTTVKHNYPDVAFSSLFNRLIISFDEPNKVPSLASVVAMHHGYRRSDKSTLWNEAISYVLVQVRKGENKDNSDTLIHKVLPADKFDEIAEKAQKQFKNFKQYTIKNQPSDKELESIVFAIKTDEKGNGDRRQDGGHFKMENNALSKVIHKIMDIFKKPDSRELANYRAKLRKYNIKPEVVKFKDSDGKSSMMYEIDTKSILRAFKDVLSSKKLKTYADNVVNKAASVYRMFKEEIEDAE